MLSAAQIKMLHIAKSRAGISQERYVAILREVAGVESSKDPDLNNRDCDRILAALTVKREGWQEGQLRKWREYAGYCRMALDEARIRLYKATGAMNEEASTLDQEQFERVMAEMEEELEKRIADGVAPLPDGVDLNYWRMKLPGAKLTSRQAYEIERIWDQLSPYLPEEQRGFSYLCSILARACRMKFLRDYHDLPAWKAIKAIETLKIKLEQEQKKIVEEVPF